MWHQFPCSGEILDGSRSGRGDMWSGERCGEKFEEDNSMQTRLCDMSRWTLLRNFASRLWYCSDQRGHLCPITVDMAPEQRRCDTCGPTANSWTRLRHQLSEIKTGHHQATYLSECEQRQREANKIQEFERQYVNRIFATNNRLNIIGLEVACTLDIDLGRIAKKSVQDRGFGLHPTICHTTLKLIMTLDWDALDASLEWKGIVLSNNSVSYNDI